VTEETRRSSDEEFQDRTDDGNTREAAAAATDSGQSDLERAGLFVLGAAVAGAILSNGQRVESNTGDRIILRDDEGAYRVLKDDDTLLRQPGSDIRTERFTDGSTRTVVTREDGTRITTIRDSSGRALRRVRIEPDGTEYLLIDDTRTFEPVVVRNLPQPVTEPFDYRASSDAESLRRALMAADRRDIGRSFSLRQVRDIVEVRELAHEINLGGITFATNSAAVPSSEAEQLRVIGVLLRDLIREDPTELFLVEGHTDAVGNAGSNLLLSDRRAESVALALTEYFGVPAENIVVQGYGESFLKIATQSAERLNRRVAVRRITELMQ
jgi:outer membrane protein OmpA-like peptidoglycan-associated protein